MGARTKARKRALDLLFEAEQRRVDPVTLLDERVAVPVTPAPLPEYTAQLVRGVVAHLGQIDDALTTYAKDWPLDRMPAVDRNLLRVSAFELLFNDEVPDKVAIAEGVALATELSTEESPKFVGGLLNRLAEVKDTLV